MSNEIDELLQSLLREIPETKPKPSAPPKPTEEAVRQAEKIVQDVEEDKSWQIPPAPPKPEKPAPQHEPVIVQPAISHFTDEPSQNPAIRMHDRLDETALPKPDIERRPTQILEAKPKTAAKKKKRKKPAVKPEEAAQPKRKIPHINIPDELPPDIQDEQPTDERHEQVRSRAEMIREQLRRRAEEESGEITPEGNASLTPPELPAAAEDSDAMLQTIRQQVDEAFAREQKSKGDSEEKPVQLRRLNMAEEPVQSARPSLFGRFRQKKDKEETEESGQDGTETDWRTLVEPSGEGVREIVNLPDADPEDAEEDYPKDEPETPPAPDPETPPMPALIETSGTAEELPDPETPPMPDPETPPMPKNAFAAALREALDETAEELAEMKAEPLPEQEEGVKIQFLKRHSYFLAGIVCFVFAVIGLVTSVLWCWDKVQHFAGSASLREELADVIYPAAVVDLPAFDSPGELGAESLLSAAMVDILMYDDLSGYPESFDVISVPAGDVLARAQRMFGAEIRTEFGTLHIAGETFYYDSESGCYNVPVSPVIFSYSPEVTDIKRNGDVCTVTVLYHSDLAKWQERSENFDGGSEKTMQVTLLKSGDSYRITKIENIQTGNGE